MKETLLKLCWFIIRKLDGEVHIRQSNITRNKLVIDVERYISDTEWKHIITTSTWIKGDMFSEHAVWVNNEMVQKYLLDEPSDMGLPYIK